MDTFLFLQVPQFLSMQFLTEVKVIPPGQAVVTRAVELQADQVCSLTFLMAFEHTCCLL